MCLNVHRQADGIAQILRTIGLRRTGRAHGSRQHHRLVRCQHPMQQVGGFLERVGAVRDDHTADVRPSDVRGHSLGEPTPHRVAHVLAVDLRDLLGIEHQALLDPAPQPRHRIDQLRDPQLSGGVADVVPRGGGPSGNGSSGSQHDHPAACQRLFSRSRIRVRIKKTGSRTCHVNPTG